MLPTLLRAMVLYLEASGGGYIKSTSNPALAGKKRAGKLRVAFSFLFFKTRRNHLQ
jgi:hypothetical protein